MEARRPITTTAASVHFHRNDIATDPKLSQTMKSALLSLAFALPAADAFAPRRAVVAPPSSSATSLGMSTGIFYSTIGGDTGRCARLIGDAVGGGVAAVEIEDTTPADVTQHDALIVGAPTWNTGADAQVSWHTSRRSRAKMRLCM